MSSAATSSADESAVPLLRITLGIHPDGIRVGWRLTGVRREAGEVVATLPLTIAGGPTIALPGAGLEARDESGVLPLLAGDPAGDADDGGEQIRVWRAGRASVGAVSVDYWAEPNDAEPLPATPPLELRREGGGLVGALKCLLALPDEPTDLAFTLRAETPEGWTLVTSLGEISRTEDELAGAGLERLGDTYLIAGDLTEGHRRVGALSTWWLTRPGLDVTAFSERLAQTYRAMAETFETPSHPFRVFFRTHPHRGLNASAHPASFVMAVNPASPPPEASVHETVAHELVHEWLHLDGPEGEVRWFAEGTADYYMLMVPLQAGLLGEDDFLSAVNREARTGYANPRRHLRMDEAEPLFFGDFFAHWLPYARGMFYLADLDGRLRHETGGERSVDDVVVEVMRRRREGEWMGVDEWCTVVEQALGGIEREALDALVWTGTGRPGPTTTFGSRLELTEARAPGLDVGFDPVTLVSGRVTGLVAGGLADRAGLREGEPVEVPGFHAALDLDPDGDLVLGVTRGGGPEEIRLPLADRAVVVPQWRKLHG